MKEEKESLYPNCSEITWRLKIEDGLSNIGKVLNALKPKMYNEEEDYMLGDGDNGYGEIDAMVEELREEMSKDPEFDIGKVDMEFTEKREGGHEFDKAEELVYYAKEVAKGKMSLSEAEYKMEHKDDEETDEEGNLI